MSNFIMQKLKEFFIGSGLVVVVWQLAHIIINRNVLPSPLPVFMAMPNLLNQNIVTHFTHSAYRVFVALSISMILGLLVGIFASKSKILTSFIYFTYPIPRVALLPVVMVVFGLRDMSKIIMITLIISYPIIIVVRDSVASIPKETYNTVIASGANWLQLFFYVTLPFAFGAVFSTLRVALGTAIAILFFTETYGARYGMGHFILDSWMRLNYIQMYGGIVLLGLTGFILFCIIDCVEEVFFKG